jgi:hypothetical protein
MLSRLLHIDSVTLYCHGGDVCLSFKIIKYLVYLKFKGFFTCRVEKPCFKIQKNLMGKQIVLQKLIENDLFSMNHKALYRNSSKNNFA